MQKGCRLECTFDRVLLSVMYWQDKDCTDFFQPTRNFARGRRRVILRFASEKIVLAALGHRIALKINASEIKGERKALLDSQALCRLKPPTETKGFS